MEKKNILKLTFSPTGGTKRVMDMLADNLFEVCNYKEIDLCDRNIHYGDISIEKNDVVILAVPSYGGHVPMTAVERIKRINGNGTRAIIVCVYGNRAYDNTLAELLKISGEAGFNVIAAVAALAEHSIARKVAAGRPDKNDLECLKDMAKYIRNKIENDINTIPQVPGEAKERSAEAGPGMAPATTEACLKCGLCAAKCPVGAIDPVTLKADSKKCISCMRCIAVCPKEARKLNVVITSLGGVALEVLCKKRKENELFL